MSNSENCKELQFNSLQPYEPKPDRLLCLWGFSCKNTGVGCHPLTRGSSQPRDWTQVSCISSHILYQWDTWKALPIVLIRKQSQREMDSLAQDHCNLHKTKSGSQPSSGWLSPLIWGYSCSWIEFYRKHKQIQQLPCFFEAVSYPTVICSLLLLPSGPLVVEVAHLWVLKGVPSRWTNSKKLSSRVSPDLGAENAFGPREGFLFSSGWPSLSLRNMTWLVAL